MIIKPLKIGYSFWLQWILVTVAGFLLSLYWVEIGERTDISAVEGAIGGDVIGLAQWLVLRQQFSQAWWWVLASIVSWGLLAATDIGALGWVAPKTTYIPLRLVYGIVDGIIIGALLGVAQWFVLNKQVKIGWQWVLVSSTSWAIGLALGWLLGGVLRYFTGIFLAEIVGLTLGWVIVAAITGLALWKVSESADTESLFDVEFTTEKK
jgi:hypothetical protein